MKETARRKSERRRRGHKQQDIDTRTQRQRESDKHRDGRERDGQQRLYATLKSDTAAALLGWTQAKVGLAPNT